MADELGTEIIARLIARRQELIEQSVGLATTVTTANATLLEARTAHAMCEAELMGIRKAVRIARNDQENESISNGP